MRIDKNNYEAYLLDYLEGSISEQDKQLLFLFLDEHPELKGDLDTDINISLEPEQVGMACHFKDELLKHEAQNYDLPVKDYLFIKKAEEGLTVSEEAELLLAEPDELAREKESASYQQLRLQSDSQITFDEKNKLRRFTLLPVLNQTIASRGIAAVASIAVILTVWINLNRPAIVEPTTAINDKNNTQKIEAPAIARNKILEKPVVNQTQPSKDSLLELSKNPMNKAQTKADSTQKVSIIPESAQYLASINQIKRFESAPINAYEHGLNVMMPQYMNNNLLRAELASIYQQIEQEEATPSLSLALVEGGVKVMNFLSKESVKMNKYYNADGKVVGYKLKGDNLEVNRRVK